MGFQKIGKEKNLQDQKQKDQFYDNDCPEFFAYGHVFKTQVIKLNNIVNN